MTTTAVPAPFSPPERLLCGPGPTNVDPRILEAMSKPMLGHLDPVYQDLLVELAAMLHELYGSADAAVLALHCSGMAGMETGIANLTEPGDMVIVASAGFFGRRVADMARRYGARVVEVEAPWGDTVPNEALLDALDRHADTRLIAVVHAETSTGAAHPLEELADLVRTSDALLMADCVTSLGAMPFHASEWGIDFAYSCSQKALGAPPGISPILLSPRALAQMHTRSAPVPFSFDIELLLRYWVERPAIYHHTAPILQMYALHEAVRLALDETLNLRWSRHEAAGRHLREALLGRGLELLTDPACQLPHVSVVRVPDGIDGLRVQRRLLDEHDIEVGGGLGPASPSIWRIGLMGPNASIDIADRVLGAFDAVLASEPTSGELATDGANKLEG
jgi:alanine-glyoxylate transaminase / serine-glyoxylate transaminase / serine-pyruvate transaminase